MKCSNPYQVRPKDYGHYVKKTVYDFPVVPCGKCTACRITKKQIWQNRLELEGSYVDRKAFVTLTYSDERLPDPPDLIKAHLQSFIKTLRNRMDKLNRNFRYFGVGEYGMQKTERPHFHVILFGIDGTDYFGWSDKIKEEGFKFPKWSKCDYSIIHGCWNNGFVGIGPVLPGATRYITGYVIKKMTREDDPRLYGRAPEFSLKSQGIGKFAMENIAECLDGHDVEYPLMALRGKPLGRYLTNKLAENSGSEEELAFQRKLYLTAQACETLHCGIDFDEKSSYIADKNAQKVKNLISREKIMKRKEKL